MWVDCGPNPSLGEGKGRVEGNVPKLDFNTGCQAFCGEGGVAPAEWSTELRDQAGTWILDRPVARLQWDDWSTEFVSKRALLTDWPQITRRSTSHPSARTSNAHYRAPIQNRSTTLAAKTSLREVQIWATVREIRRIAADRADKVRPTSTVSIRTVIRPLQTWSNLKIKRAPDEFIVIIAAVWANHQITARKNRWNGAHTESSIVRSWLSRRSR